MKIHKLKNIIYLILLSVLSLFIIILPVSANVFDIIEIRNISDDRKTNVITWNTNVKTSSQGWIVADQYLYIHYDKNHTISTGWGLEIYTDNKTNTANPMYIGPSDDPSGLIKTATSNVVLPLAWRIFKEIQTNVPDPLERADHSGFQDYAWHFLQDKRSPSFLNEKDYLVPYDQGGIAWHEGSRQNKPTNAYVYIAANFDYAANFEYKTSMLKLVEFNNPTLPKFLMNYFYVYYNVWKDQEPVPNHFIPAYEDWGGGAIPTTINFEYTADYKSPGSCINITFGGTSKGALVWYEPGSDYNCPSGPGVGYNLTGATRLSFWIKGDANYNNVIAQIGLAGDSCGTIMNVDNGLDDKFNVTTSWVQHYIPLIGKDMSSVSRGFKIGMWNPIVAANIYVDDIRYEQYVFTNAGYRWTKQLGGTEKDEGRSVALDGSGNVYFTGYFRSTVNFQEDWGGTDSRLSAGENDIFITKVNSDGTYGWTKQIGGTGDDTGFAIACDSSGNIYITGSFEGTVNFAQDWLGNDTKGSSGNSDIFITKINANGTYGWTKKMGGTGYDGSYGMALDNSDNIYITGCYQYSVNFRQDWGGADTKTNAGSDDIFISKVDSDGINYYWTRRMGGSGSDCGYSLATNSSGDIYVTGCYQNTVNFGQDWSTPDIKTNAGSEDIFVSRIGQNGTSYEWTKRIGGAYSECAYGITTDKNGHVYVTGSFLGTVDFRSDWGGSDPKTSIFNSNDIFLIRINADDSYGWTKRIGNSCPYDRGEAVTTDRSNNIYVTGSFQYTVNFAQDWGGADYKSSNGMWYDAFAMRVNADGTYGSTRRFGGTSHDCGYGIVFSDTGIGYITGFFAVTANFAQDWFDVDYKSSKGLYDIFLMRFEGL